MLKFFSSIIVIILYAAHQSRQLDELIVIEGLQP